MTRDDIMQEIVYRRKEFAGEFGVADDLIRLSTTLILVFSEESVTIDSFEMAVEIGYEDIRCIHVANSALYIDLINGYGMTVYSLG